MPTVRWLQRSVAAWLVGTATSLGVAGPDAAAGEPQRVDAARIMNDLMTGRGDIGGPFLLTDQGTACRAGAVARQDRTAVFRVYVLS